LTPFSQHFWLLPLLLYAETHYRFRFFFSFLKKNEPEIIADAPHRVEPNRKLPVLILSKDADRWPCRLREVSIEVRRDEQVIQRTSHLDNPIELNTKLFSHIIWLDLSSLVGWIELDVAITLERNGKIKTYHNDNHRTSTRLPLSVFLATSSLPRFPDLYLGDPHTHSIYTEDQVEFGAPLAASRELGRAMGLSYFCATDHSYDLDDTIHSYLSNDPRLTKWTHFQNDVDALNSEGCDFVVIRGEEVSCRNKNGANVHLLLLGQREFVHGSGDGAERWLQTRSEHDIEEVVRLKSTEAVAYAAHAKEDVPVLQRLLLGRGDWSDEDLSAEGMSGLQIINGKLDDGFRKGYRSWIRLLLSGKRIYAIAGNDAHGNFNRFRQIGIPFVSIREEHHQIFGRMRTGLFVRGAISERTILDALFKGRFLMTDGPVISISAKGSSNAFKGPGEAVEGGSIDLDIQALSSHEFGEVNSLRIIVGKIGEAAERTAFRFEGNQGLSLQKQVTIKQPTASYVRAEVLTSKDNTFDQNSHFCFSNPIWILPSS
jgi:hypothetical protein